MALFHVAAIISNYISVQKVVPYPIMGVGHGADPGFLAVSPQVTLAIHKRSGRLPGTWLLSQPNR